MGDELDEDAPLTPDEILTFGPCVEAQVWTPTFVAEARAPIAVAAGRPKLGPVFNSDGVGKAVIIRPCMSRGRRVRGLAPIYTPPMLEKHAGVFDGWPMFMDHVPAELVAAMSKRGRSVKELGGQVLRGRWDRDFVQESDEQFGYRKGGTLAEVWAAPVIRKTVDNNPDLLHTSINAWPTSGKPGPCPWRQGVKGMIIEGIRRQPQGSVDYVVRGGAGGRLLVEGAEDEGAWPQIGEWNDEDVRFVVSLAESVYASPAMSVLALPNRPDELKAWLEENAPHLVPALREQDSEETSPRRKRRSSSSDSTDSTPAVKEGESGLTEADVRRLIEESSSGTPTVEEFQQSLREQTEQTLRERDEQRDLSAMACQLIETAEGIPPRWKNDLKARYSMQPDGAPASLIVEGDETDDEGHALTSTTVVEQRVVNDLDHVRDLIAEATGKPRVTGEGGRKRDRTEDAPRSPKAAHSHWRSEFARLGLAESADTALSVFGANEKVES